MTRVHSPSLEPSTSTNNADIFSQAISTSLLFPDVPDDFSASFGLGEWDPLVYPGQGPSLGAQLDITDASALAEITVAPPAVSGDPSVPDVFGMSQSQLALQMQQDSDFWGLLSGFSL